MKKQLIFGFIVGVAAGLIYFNSSIKITYYNSGTDNYSYKIKIIKFMRILTVSEYHDCNNNDCKNSDEKQSIKLTSDEYKKIRKIVKNKNFDIAKLSAALSDITKNYKIKYTKDDENYDINEDLNGDGKTTYKESGMYYINTVTSENK